MFVIKQCCFWRDLSYPVAAGAMFCLGLSLFYIAVWISIWVNGVYPSNALVSPSSYPIINTMIIPIIFDLFSVLTAIAALYGVAMQQRRYLSLWLVYLPIYIIFQIFILILLIVVLAAFSDNQKGLLVTVVIFWFVQIAINIGGELVTYNYYDSLRYRKGVSADMYKTKNPNPFSGLYGKRNQQSTRPRNYPPNAGYYGPYVTSY